MKKLVVRVVGSKPKKKAPFAPDLAIFKFARVGRTFECEGFEAVTPAQLDGLRRVAGSPAGGAVEVTPTQAKLLVKKAREHAPFWRSVRAEPAAAAAAAAPRRSRR